VRLGANLGVGCVTAVAGGASGGMVGVLVAKAVTAAHKCVPVEGLPACDWHLYFGWGVVIGVVTLPSLVLWHMRRGETGRGPGANVEGGDI